MVIALKVSFDGEQLCTVEDSYQGYKYKCSFKKNEDQYLPCEEIFLESPEGLELLMGDPLLPQNIQQKIAQRLRTIYYEIMRMP